MTPEKAKEALKAGKKITHKSWTGKEFIKKEIREIIVDEKGETYSESIFAVLNSNDWEIVE